MTDYQPRVFVNLRWPGPDFHLRGAFSSSPFQTARNSAMLASNFELNFSFEGLQSTSVQKCTYLDARLRLVNGMKCPAKTRVSVPRKPPVCNSGVSVCTRVIFRLGLLFESLQGL